MLNLLTPHQKASFLFLYVHYGYRLESDDPFLLNRQKKRTAVEDGPPAMYHILEDKFPVIVPLLRITPRQLSLCSGFVPPSMHDLCYILLAPLSLAFSPCSADPIGASAIEHPALRLYIPSAMMSDTPSNLRQ